MRLKRTLLLIFFLIAGVVLGALAANLCAGIGPLRWLAFSRSIGFNPEAPLVLDFSMVKITFGFALDVSVAQVITVALAILLYNLLFNQKKVDKPTPGQAEEE